MIAHGEHMCPVCEAQGREQFAQTRLDERTQEVADLNTKLSNLQEKTP